MAEPDDVIERLRAWVRVLLDDAGSGTVVTNRDVYDEPQAIVSYRNPWGRRGRILLDLAMLCLVRDLADEIAGLRARVQELEQGRGDNGKQ